MAPQMMSPGTTKAPMIHGMSLCSSGVIRDEREKRTFGSGPSTGVLVPAYLFALTKAEQPVEMRFLRLARTGSDYIRISKLPGPTAGLFVAPLIFKKAQPTCRR